MSRIQRHRVVLDSYFDLDVTVDSWIYPDIQPTPEIKLPGMFARCIPIDGHLVSIGVQQFAKGEVSELEVRWTTGFRVERKAVVDRMKWLLGWDIDTRCVLATMSEDPIISHLVEPLRGLRPFSLPSLFEALVKAILQQQVSYRSASQVTRNLVLTYGSRCHLGKLELFGFPTVDQLGALSERELREVNVGYKAPYLMELCQKISRGDLELNNLINQNSNDVLKALDALHGVGIWTAELTVLTGLRHLDVFPADDLGLRQLISKFYLGGLPAKRKDIEQVAVRWGDQAPLVLYFLMSAQVLGLL